MTRALLAFVLAGCNQILGLDSTAPDPCPLDRDCDGIHNELDNCPDVANIDQLDVDHDKIGDVCDPCSWVNDPAMDDDGDFIASAQDRCPAVYDQAQADSDGDGVGDACDPSPSAANMLTCFADFAVAATSTEIWHLTGDWVQQQSRIAHPAETTMPSFVWSLAPLADTFTIEVATNGDTISPAHFEVGVGIADPADMPGTRCVTVRLAGGTTRVALLDHDAVLAEQDVANAFSPALVSLTRADGQLSCTITSLAQTLATVTAPAPQLPVPFAVSLISDNIRSVFIAVTFYR